MLLMRYKLCQQEHDAGHEQQWPGRCNLPLRAQVSPALPCWPAASDGLALEDCKNRDWIGGSGIHAYNDKLKTT